LNLLLLPNGQVGKEVLHFLLDEYLEDVGLVVVIAENDISAVARRAGRPTLVFSGSHHLTKFIQGEGIEFDLGILAWWPTIIKPPLVSLPRLGFINCHPSLLPYNRGKHYNFWAIVEEAPFGVSLHFLGESIDSGDVVSQREVAYDWTDTGESLYLKAQQEIVRLFRNTYPVLRSSEIPRKAQDLSEGSFHKAAELQPASRIDLDRQYSARQLLNLLRARTFRGYPACQFEDKGEMYEVRVEIRRLSE
jgi:methionyl-tRNA formyltransferase